MQPLVPYADSDEDDDEQAKVAEQAVDRPSNDSARRSVYTSLGVMRSEPQKGDWLCSVHVPLTGCDRLLDVLERATEHLSRSMNGDVTVAEHSTLHVSLTRPIVLRRSECSTLVEVIRTAVRSYSSGLRCTNSSIALSFGQFALLPSEQGDRLYFVAEIGPGWDLLRKLTSCLDQALQDNHIGRPYFEQARFHVSFASVADAQAAQAEQAVKAMNDRIGKKLRSIGQLFVEHVEVTTGTRAFAIPLNS